MDFQKAEIVFYTAVSLSGIIGGIIRVCRDGVSYGAVGNVGRCLSSGLVSFGAIGLWIGHDTTSATGPFYYLAAASLIGYASHDVHDKVFNRVIGAVLDKLGTGDKKS